MKNSKIASWARSLKTTLLIVWSLIDLTYFAINSLADWQTVPGSSPL